jgi:hypothetical protein
MKLGSWLLLIGGVVGAGWCWYFAPYYIDWIKMDEVVGDAALSWRAYGLKRGEEELAGQIKDRGLPDYLHPGLCTFDEHRTTQELRVYCAWKVDVYLPGPLPARRLSFESEKVVGPDGRLE